MKLCSLILAHGKLEVLDRLIRRLLDAGIACHVHLDVRADLAPFRAALPTETRFVEKRVAVRWGGFSMVDAVIGLADQAMEDAACTHFLHISGDTYPIVPMSNLIAQLTADQDWIDCFEIPPGDPTYTRISRLYVPDHPISELSQRESYELRHLDDGFLTQIDAMRSAWRMKHEADFPWRYAKGANWWMLRRETLATGLAFYRDRPDWTDWFRFSAHPDESFFNSLVLNFVPGAGQRGGPVFTLWDREPRPYEFGRPADLSLLLPATLPLARKFAAQSHDLLDAIDLRTGTAG